MASKNKPAAQARSKAPKPSKDSKKDKGQELARHTGVKVSAANAYLKEAARSGSVKRVGGYSGHWLYQVVSS